MSIKFTSLVLCGALSCAVAFSAPVMAQDADHISAAKKAIDATSATANFDFILMKASDDLKKRLTVNNPDKSDQIDQVVLDEAVALAPRRADLENEAAKLFAATFTKDELDQIAAFFATETGKKYLGSTPVLARELSKAARIWGTGIQRDLSTNATKKLSE